MKGRIVSIFYLFTVLDVAQHSEQAQPPEYEADLAVVWQQEECFPFRIIFIYWIIAIKKIDLDKVFQKCCNILYSQTNPLFRYLASCCKRPWPSLLVAIASLPSLFWRKSVSHNTKIHEILNACLFDIFGELWPFVTTTRLLNKERVVSQQGGCQIE